MVFAHRQARKRREALQAFAAKRGLAFTEGHDQEHDDRFARFGMFRRGHSRAPATPRGRLRQAGPANVTARRLVRVLLSREFILPMCYAKVLC